MSQYSHMSRDQILDVLYREILAARLKVTLDRELNRPTSEMVMRLSNMKLPPHNPVLRAKYQVILPKKVVRSRL